MCGGRLAPTAVLAALVVGGLAMPMAPSMTKTSRRLCLGCLAESLHETANMIEGWTEQEPDPLMTEAPASDR